MARRNRDLIAPGLLGVAVGFNYFVHRTGWADTICMNGRRALRTDTTAGKVVSVIGATGFITWFIPHFILGPLEDIVEND
jgi:hypothetical protein